MATTLAAARLALWKEASSVPYLSRTPDDVAAVDSVINQVIERFLTEGKWRGTTCRARFTVYDGQITLPEILGTVLGWANTGLNGTCWGRGAVYSQWYDFVTHSSIRCGVGMVDIGENWPTFRDSPYETFKIKVVSNNSGETSHITLTGLDDYGRKIYRANGLEGVKLQIRNTPHTTTQVFSFLHGWIKSFRTRGIVRIYAVEVGTNEETLIGYINPGKLISGYRRYKLTGSVNETVVECMCKRAYVEAVADNDLLIPSSLVALKFGMKAIQYEDKNDFENGVKAMARAVDHLDKERSEWDGDNQLLTVRFVGDYGAGSIAQVM